MRRFIGSMAIVLTVFFTSCTENKAIAQRKPAAFAKGGDVGWPPQMEATGYKFYDADGTEKDCLQLLKERGMNNHQASRLGKSFG